MMDGIFPIISTKDAIKELKDELKIKGFPKVFRTPLVGENTKII